MARGQHFVVLNAGEQPVWQFINDCAEWATLMPGYLHHEFPSNDEMIWVFKGDFGFIQKAVKVQLTVTERTPSEKIAFQLKGLSDNINGEGAFTLTPLADGTVQLTGSLQLEGGGFMAAMINPVLEKFVPETITQLVMNMEQAIQQTAR